MSRIFFLAFLLVSVYARAEDKLEKRTFVEIIEACREMEISKSTYLFSQEVNAYRLGVILENFKESDPEKSIEVAYNVLATCKEPKVVESYELKVKDGNPVIDMIFEKGKRITFQFKKENDLWVIAHTTTYVGLGK